MGFQGVLMLLSSAFLAASGSELGLCCKTCGVGLSKFYSIPNPDTKNPECGECCLKPSRYHFWKLFEPKLLPGDCASQGFTKYVSTETDGIPPMAVTNDRYVHAMESFNTQFCPEKLQAVYADMHDGDMKEVSISGTNMTIKPSGNNQTWVVHTRLDPQSCSASINFTVPGKPSPPPVNLLATLWYSFNSHMKKTEFEFTDPSGTLASKGFPLNRWIELKKAIGIKDFGVPCQTKLHTVFADMHDGDKKSVAIVGDSMIIRPSGNNQTWVVTTNVDPKSCSANIDFNVTGKPNPPPVNLTATLFYTVSAKEKRTELEFTDPSGRLAMAKFPLNHWVETPANGINEIVI